MNPVILGVVLGIANVIVTAILFVATMGDHDAAGAIVGLGMLPAMAAGSLIGSIARATTHRGRLLRGVALGAPTLFLVLCLGTFFDLLGFVPIAAIPALLACAVLESRTRNLQPPAPPAVRLDGQGRLLTPVKLAMVLGALTTLLAMAGLCAKERTLAWFFEGYLPWGLGCGMGLAAPFGALAEWLGDEPVWVRRFTLLGFAALLTFSIGSLFGPQAYPLMLLSFIPTAAGCLLLERYSRPCDVVPRAIAR